MRPVKPPLTADRPRVDPAPSKWQYRMERLWLTPLFKALVRTGIPSFSFVFLFTWYINDPARITAIVDTWEGWKQSVQDRPQFMVSLLRIEGASEQLQSDIAEALPIDLPLSQFQLDMDGLRNMLKDLDPVEEAEVLVQAGGVLLLKITERDPAVVWQHADGIEVLDVDGHRVATLEDLTSAGPLPLIGGEGADAHVPEAMALLEVARPITKRLVGLTRVGNRRWDVVLTRGQRIMLPEEAPAAALDRAVAMQKAQAVLSRDVTVVDLRIPDRPVLRLTTEARGELRGLQELERLSLSEVSE